MAARSRHSSFEDVISTGLDTSNVSRRKGRLLLKLSETVTITTAMKGRKRSNRD